jgi:hypothetical protein
MFILFKRSDAEFELGITFTQRWLRFPCPNKIDHFVHNNGDRKTEFFESIFTIKCVKGLRCITIKVEKYDSRQFVLETSCHIFTLTSQHILSLYFKPVFRNRRDASRYRDLNNFGNLKIH